MPITVENLATTPPQVGVTVTGLDESSASVISVQRSWDEGRSWHAVQGADHVSVTGAWFVRDHAPALNVPAVYRVVVHSGPGLVAESSPLNSGPITLVSDVGYIMDPLDPASAVAVAFSRRNDTLYLLSDSANAYTLDQPVDLATPMGARLPVASIGQRQAAAGLPLHLRAAAGQGALVNALRRLLDDTGQVALVGLPAALGLDAVMHVAAAATDVPVVGGAVGQVRDLLLDTTQVRPQSLRIVVPFYTYADVAALVEQVLGVGATYADVMAATPDTTYLDWIRDPEGVLGL